MGKMRNAREKGDWTRRVPLKRPERVREKRLRGFLMNKKRRFQEAAGRYGSSLQWIEEREKSNSRREDRSEEITKSRK